MLDAYTSLPVWLRTVLALVVLGTGITLTFIGFEGRSTNPTGESPVTDTVQVVEPINERGARGLFRVGMAMSVAGAIMFVFTGKSKAEKSGYNF